MNQGACLEVDDIPMLAGAGRVGPTLLFHRDRVRFLQQLVGGGDLFRVHLLDRKVVVVTGPAAVQQVLVEHAASMEKAALQRYLLYPLIGEGLFTSGGALWRRQRKLMAPIFPPGQIARFADSMVACARRDVDTWADGATLDIAQKTARIAMSIAGKTLFDAETFSEADQIGAALTEALRWAGSQVTTPLPLLQIALRRSLEGLAHGYGGRMGALFRRLVGRLHGPVIFFTAADRRLLQAVALLDQRVQRMIDERRAAGPEQARADLLARLLAARDDGDEATMSDRQVRDEVLTLFVAGHETTASALAWALYLLARHPGIYRRVQAEADALEGPPRYQDLARMPLALRVFKEALRLYPPVPMYVRDVAADVVIGGYRLPAGTVLFLCPYATHHRADLWPDPERFDPDRFAPEAEAARPRYAFLPFSAGPRVCIGNHFALMEGPLVLATLLQRADFELAGTTAVEPEVQATLRPRGGVPMRIRLRRAARTTSAALPPAPTHDQAP